MQSLRFIVAHGPYQPGEIAGFADAEAAKLIGSGVAVANEPQQAEPSAAEPGDTGPATIATVEAEPADTNPAEHGSTAKSRRTEPARARQTSPEVTKAEGEEPDKAVADPGGSPETGKE